MKQKFQQISAIGNIYILIFALGFLLDSELLNTLATIVFFITLLVAISILKKPSKKLADLLESYPKTAVFLSHTGWCAYLILPVYIIGLIDGYRITSANYTGENFEPLLPLEFYNYYGWVCLTFILLSLIYAIYRCIKAH